MPGFTPGRRWQPPFHPFKQGSFGSHTLEAVERVVKGPMFLPPTTTTTGFSASYILLHQGACHHGQEAS